MDGLDAWSAVAVALAIGLLVGAERESSKHEVGSPGVRTFALAAVIGVVATMVPTVVAAVLLGGIGVMAAMSYWASRSVDPGLTSEAALLVTVALGALTATEPALAVGIAVVVTALLLSKQVLHDFLRETVTDLERTDALKFFVAAFIVLPLLPDDPIGPYDVLCRDVSGCSSSSSPGSAGSGTPPPVPSATVAACWSRAWPAGSSRGR